MAVLPHQEIIQASIIIDGVPAKEYVDKDEELTGSLAGKSVVKYIEAESSKEFAIMFHITKTSPIPTSMTFNVWIDGQWITGIIYDIEQQNRQEWVHGLKGQSIPENDSTFLRKFMFSPVNVVEDCSHNRVVQDSKMIKEGLGEIVIKVHHVTIKPGVVDPTGDEFNQGVNLEIAEKAVKGQDISHGVSFGAKVPTTAIHIRETIKLDKQPFGIFRFRYRSRESLQRLLIIPRAPTPDPFEALPAEEIRRLARERFANLQKVDGEKIKTGKKIKRERTDDDEEVTVDLTGDDGKAVVTTKPKKKARNGNEENIATVEILDD